MHPRLQQCHTDDLRTWKVDAKEVDALVEQINAVTRSKRTPD
jgi:hypothetical protein